MLEDLLNGLGLNKTKEVDCGWCLGGRCGSYAALWPRDGVGENVVLLGAEGAVHAERVGRGRRQGRRRVVREAYRRGPQGQRPGAGRA